MVADEGKLRKTGPYLSADNIASHLSATKDVVYTWSVEKTKPAH